MSKVKAFELREKNVAELLKLLEEQKHELSQLRIAQVTGGAAARIAKIKVVRKNIARVNSVYTEKMRTETRAKHQKKTMPIDLRGKFTKRIRNQLTKTQASAVTRKERTRMLNFPQRRYVVEM